MNIKLITFHTPKNYGAALQAVALSNKLKEFDSNVKVINYNTAHLRSMYQVLHKPKSLRSFIKWLLLLPIYHDREKQYRKFEDFITSNLPLTTQCTTQSELSKVVRDADVVFTGSDQIFNPNRIQEERKAFYLSFVPNGIKRVSYAASFGVKEIPLEKRAEITEYLNAFSSISVREKNGIAIVKSLVNCDVTHVLDPVFLYEESFWHKLSRKYAKIDGQYVLYYRLLGDSNGDRYAREYARKTKTKLVVISQAYGPYWPATILHDVGPDELLDLYERAKYVVTDAFHGVAFALIFGKQFMFTDTNNKTNGRGYDLLKQLDIEKETYIMEASPTSSVDYHIVSDKLGKLRADSIQYISNAIYG